jgi:hypothetical protein
MVSNYGIDGAGCFRCSLRVMPFVQLKYDDCWGESSANCVVNGKMALLFVVSA